MSSVNPGSLRRRTTYHLAQLVTWLLIGMCSACVVKTEPLKGDPGERGERGERGLPGQDGPAGSAGPTGQAGPIPFKVTALAA